MPELLVLHSCDTPRCVNPAHLFLGTNLDNTADALSKERMASGEDNGSVKVSDSDIQQILFLRSLGFEHQEIANRFKLSETHVCNICNGKARVKQ